MIKRHMHLLDRAQSRITLIIHIRVQLVCVWGGEGNSEVLVMHMCNRAEP